MPGCRRRGGGADINLGSVPIDFRDGGVAVRQLGQFVALHILDLLLVRVAGFPDASLRSGIPGDIRMRLPALARKHMDRDLIRGNRTEEVILESATRRSTVPIDIGQSRSTNEPPFKIRIRSCKLDAVSMDFNTSQARTPSKMGN